MANEKYLDYAGLQYYHEKLNLDLASMLMTDDDLNDILFDELDIAPPLPETWTESANGTLNLSLSNAYSYWPEGAGTKTISIANGTTAGISKFFLKLTDAGNFPMEWGSNIQWKNGSEPEWQAFHEDIIIFKSNDSGSTWIGQVIATNAITPYWKLTMQVPWKQYSERTGSYSEDAYFIRLNLTSLSNDTVIEWGDGSSTNVTNTSAYYVHEHEYAGSGTYHIKVTSNKFHTAALLDWLGIEWLVSDSDWRPYTETLYSVDSPYPLISGIWRDTSSSNHFERSFGGCFYYCKKLTQIPDKLFYNNPQSISFSECFDGCSSITSIPSGLFDKQLLVTDFYSCFDGCSSITSIPSGLFDNNTRVTSFAYCFNGCSSITSIPTNLFFNNSAVTYFWNCFKECTSLDNFTLNIGSSSVSNASDFVTKKTGTTRTINVPSGSTTRTTFNNVASSLGLTIVGV